MSLSRFDKLWDLVVHQVVNMSVEEVNADFMKERNLHVCNLDELKKDVGSYYAEAKEQIKLKCYEKGKKDNLDLHKLASIFCAGLIKYKPIVFDDKLDEKDLTKTRTFIINNYLIEKVANDTELLNQILAMKYLEKYPKNDKHTPFEQSAIIELGRNDYSGNLFDIFSFSIILFQWQEYTLLKAKYNLKP